MSLISEFFSGRSFSMHELKVFMQSESVSVSESDSRDRRRRKTSLTPKGRRLVRKLQPVWNAFENAGKEILKEGDNDLIGAINKFESAL